MVPARNERTAAYFQTGNLRRPGQGPRRALLPITCGVSPLTTKFVISPNPQILEPFVQKMVAHAEKYVTDTLYSIYEMQSFLGNNINPVNKEVAEKKFWVSDQRNDFYLMMSNSKE